MDKNNLFNQILSVVYILISTQSSYLLACNRPHSISIVIWNQKIIFSKLNCSARLQDFSKFVPIVVVINHNRTKHTVNTDNHAI